MTHIHCAKCGGAFKPYTPEGDIGEQFLLYQEGTGGILQWCGHYPYDKNKLVYYYHWQCKP